MTFPIGPGRLSERGGGGQFVEEIVRDLKRQPGVNAKTPQRLDVFRSPATERGSDLACRPDQRTGLARMNGGDVHNLDRLAFGEDVGDLSTDEPPRAAGIGQKANALETGKRIGCGISQDLKGQGKERVPGENRQRLAEFDVASGSATAKFIVVDGRQIVVNERETMNEFDGASRIESGFRFASRCRRACHAKGGAKAFARAQRRISHRGEELGGLAASRLQEVRKAAVDFLGEASEP